MAQRKTLTEAQVSVLRWVADGCPDGVVDGTHHRISAAALRRRGLLNVSGHGARWSATITDAGRDYLTRVDGLNPPVPRTANVSVTQQFVDDLVAAGGVCRFPAWRWNDPDSVDYEHRAKLAQRHNRAPAGKQIVTAWVEHELEVRLVDMPPDWEARRELTPVPVPEKVGRFHPAARALRDRRDDHEVSRAILSRATRIAHAIAEEAERRGWSVDTDLKISAADRTFGVHLWEKGVHARGTWEAEVERHRGRTYYFSDREVPSGAYDAKATGELNLKLSSDKDWIFRGRQRQWGDRQSWRLEERLPHLFREMEERIFEADRVAEQERIKAERAAEAARREAEERERQWNVLMDEARAHLDDDHRAAHLRRQSESWHEACRLRDYCAAVETAYGGNAATAEWVAWARSYADRIDPLSEPPTTPNPPEQTAERLQQYLPEGWSAEGPEHGRTREPWTRRWGR